MPNLRDESAVAVIDDGRRRGRGENGIVDEGWQRQAGEAEEDGGKARHPHPNPSPQGGREQIADVPQARHRPMTTRLPALVPITPALYISSAAPGGCVKEPAICARVRYTKR